MQSLHCIVTMRTLCERSGVGLACRSVTGQLHPWPACRKCGRLCGQRIAESHGAWVLLLAERCSGSRLLLQTLGTCHGCEWTSRGDTVLGSCVRMPWCMSIPCLFSPRVPKCRYRH